jgi:hypothetical protein
MNKNKKHGGMANYDDIHDLLDTNEATNPNADPLRQLLDQQEVNKIGRGRTQV